MESSNSSKEEHLLRLSRTILFSQGMPSRAKQTPLFSQQPFQQWEYDPHPGPHIPPCCLWSVCQVSLNGPCKIDSTNHFVSNIPFSLYLFSWYTLGNANWSTPWRMSFTIRIDIFSKGLHCRRLENLGLKIEKPVPVSILEIYPENLWCLVSRNMSQGRHSFKTSSTLPFLVLVKKKKLKLQRYQSKEWIKGRNNKTAVHWINTFSGIVSNWMLGHSVKQEISVKFCCSIKVPSLRSVEMCY